MPKVYSFHFYRIGAPYKLHNHCSALTEKWVWVKSEFIANFVVRSSSLSFLSVLKWAPVFWHRVTKVGQLKKPSFPISTNRDENRPLKRMVITTWPIMMIISNFEKKRNLMLGTGEINRVSGHILFRPFNFFGGQLCTSPNIATHRVSILTWFF